MTVDLRILNASTKPRAWLILNLQDELHDLHGSEGFPTLDFCEAIDRYLCTKILKIVNLSSRVLPPVPMQS
jgi:hypothetical protein